MSIRDMRNHIFSWKTSNTYIFLDDCWLSGSDLVSKEGLRGYTSNVDYTYLDEVLATEGLVKW